jgi:hypothetical protein
VAIYLPSLVHVELKGLSQCTSLPPLGQLQNLKRLNLWYMPSITKIDQGLCGNGLKAFGQLEELTISKMDSLEEWSTHTPVVRKVYAVLHSSKFAFCREIHEPLQWLRELTSLRVLKLSWCLDIHALLEWLGNLVSLRELSIQYCEGIGSLPESIQQLTNLQLLSVHECPELCKWYESGENKTKIGHIKHVSVDIENMPMPSRYYQVRKLV